MIKSTRWVLVMVAAAGLALGCSDDGDKDKTLDGGQPDKAKPINDAGHLPDGYKLWDCEKPGQACNAHDPCAINPVCSPEGKCVPSALQNCNDDLDCTTDTCAGLGLCDNKPKKGWCALPVKVTGNTKCADIRSDAGVKPFDAGTGADAGADAGAPPKTNTIMCCFKQDDRSPHDTCLVCDATAASDGSVAGDPKKWSAANGGACDDGNSCSKGDYCQNGQCKGTFYGNSCADNLSCTTDKCDGKGGCLGNKLKSDYCLINGVCYKDKQKHPGGSCFVCDVTQTQGNWSSITSSCFIGGKCYMPNDKDPTKCGICDPTKSTTAWTMLPGLCKIGGVCYTKGSKHSGKCAECDPTKSTTAWTVTDAKSCLIADVCKKTGDKDATGCSACAPTKSQTGWTQLPGLCKIDGKCYSSGTKNTGGCASCEPNTSSTKWTVSGTTHCLISKTCYAKGAKDTTGCSECAPTKTKYGWSTVANNCFIGGKCYAKGAKHSSGCGACAPTKSSTSWTVIGDKCLIAGTCYAKAATNSNGCGTCDPTKTKTNWSAVKGKCMVQGQCVTDKTKDTNNCLVCDYAKKGTEWSASGSTTVSVYGFDKGAATGWALSNTDSKVGWVVTSNRPSSGSYALYYGNPATKSYDSGAKNSGTASSPTITLKAGKTAGLSFMVWISTESLSTYDMLSVHVNSTKVWGKNSPSSNITMKKWTRVNVDLSKFAGQAVTVKFSFDTVDSVSNSTEGVYIDEMYVWHGC